MNDIQRYLKATRDEEPKKAKKDWSLNDFLEAGGTAEEYLDYVWERACNKYS